MGETRVNVRVYGPNGHANVEMLVDAGAIFAKIPEPLARRLGIVADETVAVRLGDGAQKERGLANAELEFGSSRRAVSVTIGSHAEESLLGLTALGTLRLKFNPLTQELEPSAAIEYLTRR